MTHCHKFMDQMCILTQKYIPKKKIHNCHNFIKYTKKILYLIVNIFDIVHAGTFYKLAGYQNLTYEKT